MHVKRNLFAQYTSIEMPVYLVFGKYTVQFYVTVQCAIWYL